jgi:hypothetical protein
VRVDYKRQKENEQRADRGCDSKLITVQRVHFAAILHKKI